MKILISNDDGIYAEGVLQLESTLRKECPDKSTEIFIIAPDRRKSGASHSFTIDLPLRVKWLSRYRASVEGTPTDCVRLAITGLLKQFKPDIVLSGINCGANLGSDVLYSGTVAAAIEGHFFCLPSMAVSLVTDELNTNYFETAAEITMRLVHHMLEKPFPECSMLNVNVPNIPLDALRGYKITRLGSRRKTKSVIEEKDPHGRKIYWLGSVGTEENSVEETDFYAVHNNYVSITPLKIDFTNYAIFNEAEDWLSDLEKP